MTRLHYIQFTFINNYSRRSWVYIVGATSETFEIFKRWRKMVEKETNSKIPCVHTNMGSEYMSTQILNFCNLHGSQNSLLQHTRRSRTTSLRGRIDIHIYIGNNERSTLHKTSSNLSWGRSRSCWKLHLQLRPCQIPLQIYTT